MTALHIVYASAFVCSAIALGAAAFAWGYAIGCERTAAKLNEMIDKYRRAHGASPS
ncbi:hypothetical protein BJ122_102223 [Rhodopseudomonas faecalis]|uniref:Uncharacterized protein n=1 Tax=Rhodopseudomonas faecalis TaxID=99655 RepID=A0A318TMA4_9BRAD|nr:hypothetical protein [Rhodopseudomonas faecalis]PYF04997.1 hypothetical protein BJ122_102223 [Rhodopseudomonas faecalis]